jgi:hypothetical protein
MMEVVPTQDECALKAVKKWHGESADGPDAGVCSVKDVGIQQRPAPQIARELGKGFDWAIDNTVSLSYTPKF